MSHGKDRIRMYNEGPKSMVKEGKLHAICLPRAA